MRWLYTVIALASLLLAACGSGTTPTETAARPNARLEVVATFSVLADLVQAVGGEHLAVHTLVPVGSDTHTFAPAPANAAALAEADVVFEIGHGFEGWLDDLYTAADAQAPRVVVSDGIELLAPPEGDEHGDEHAEEDEHGEFDPHVWHSVANTITLVENIRGALVAADPERAEAYQANAQAYIAELQALDAWIFEQVETIPAENRKLVTTHDTFSYFADRYGFEVVGTALGSASTEVADPSAQQVAALVEEIRATGVPAIFAENVSNPRLMEQIAREAGVRLAPPLYTDALGEPGTPAEDYVGMMRYNVSTIVEALRGG